MSILSQGPRQAGQMINEREEDGEEGGEGKEDEEEKGAAAAAAELHMSNQSTHQKHWTQGAV